jgi:glycosyltransferase involved in cell wall biosynthesis
MDALPISIVLIARDEAERLAELLPRLGFAREIVVVVDAATRDATREIAARHGARVFERAFDGFGPQRAYALARAREPWVLWLDADERLDPAALAAISGAVARGAAAGYRLERATWFLGRRIRHCGWRGEKVLRLFRREGARFDRALVHERVEVAGPVADLAGLIEHRSYERWEDCRAKLFAYAAAGTEEARRKGRRASALDVVLRPPLRFLRMYVLQAGFLDGAHGAALCALAAAQVLLKYAGLWARPAEAGGGPPGREAS